MIKIAFLSFYSGEIERGVEVATEVLVNRLSKEFDITLFQAGQKINSQIKTVKLSINVDWKIKLNKLGRLFYLDYLSRKIALFTIKFLPFLFREKYDIVIPTNGGWQTVICRLITWVLGKKLIVQGNAGIGKDDLWQLFCRPDIYIAISPQGYQWAISKALKKQITYIPYGVDLKIFRKAKPIGIKLKKPIVLCVAAFEEYKRIDLLIYAMTLVKNASLILIGNGPLESDLRKLGEELLVHRFQIKTNISHDNLVNYYKSADVFSLPSRPTEALGIVYLEAMSAGIPVVATDDYNRRQIIGNAGVLVDPQNKVEYAKAIEKALKTDFGDRPYQQAVKFSWDKIISQYNKIFNTLVS